MYKRSDKSNQGVKIKNTEKAPKVLFLKLLAILPSGSAGKNSKNFCNFEKWGGTTTHPDRHITEKQFYKVMTRVGDLLGINYLGTHTMRKTGAYRVYTQSNYNIGLVMHLLNHSSEAMTLTYLGLDQASRETMLDQIDFG